MRSGYQLRPCVMTYDPCPVLWEPCSVNRVLCVGIPFFRCVMNCVLCADAPVLRELCTVCRYALRREPGVQRRALCVLNSCARVLCVRVGARASLSAA